MSRESRNGLLRTVLGLVGGRALTVLVYHRVLAQHDPMRPSEPTAGEFESRVRWLNANFRIVPLADGIAGLARGGLPPRALAITFDDGYRDNHDIALPILARLGVPATFFIAAGYLDGGVMFNDIVIEAVRVMPGPTLDLGDIGLGVHALREQADRRAAADALLARIKYLPPGKREETARRIADAAGASPATDLMMSSAQVAALRGAGMGIGAHTVSHPILARIDTPRARAEIVAGRGRLESITGAGIDLFAYPNGKPGVDYQLEHVDMVREAGYSGAVSTARGAGRPGSDLWQIPRFTPWDAAHWKFGLRLAADRLRRPAGAKRVSTGRSGVALERET